MIKPAIRHKNQKKEQRADVLANTHTLNESGQTLLIIFFVMVIALSVGVAVSNRFISTIRSSTRSHTAYRAQAVAEAGAERILLKSVEELEDYINFGSCGSECFLEIVNEDGLIETVTIELSYLGNSTDPYSLTVTQDASSEINLSGYTDNSDISVCWDNPESGSLPSVFAMLVYAAEDTIEMDTHAYNSVGSVENNGFSTAFGASGYANCFTVNSQTAPELLRLRTFYNEADIIVIPASGTSLPSQGILIESTGKVLDATKKLIVIKGENVVPMLFDYALYSKSQSDPLSN